ncbi:hypothetical protein [Staphylococcus kloosii]|jgi:hypothetical protein|uniref:hypothetical protein n=1 Tax=Staphylococcus kloosii TaxID=29384 RepID=UPI00189FE06A|nr:hypothetical protein [Staphylococcus kloosii]MBF7025569.1 hypothetical protein [Staphylococcus kloosii]
MSKPVKLAVGIYLGTILILCSGYLILILVGSFQGNDMRGAITDANNTRNFETIGDIEQDSQFFDDNLILNIP